MDLSKKSFALLVGLGLACCAFAATSASLQHQQVEKEVVQAKRYFNGQWTGEVVALPLLHISDNKGGRETLADTVALDTSYPPPPQPAGCGVGCTQVDAHSSTFCSGGKGVTAITYVYTDNSGQLYFQTVTYTYNSPTCQNKTPM